MEEIKKAHQEVNQLDPRHIQNQQASQIERIRQKANDADQVVDSPALTYGSPEIKKKKKRGTRDKGYDLNSSAMGLLRSN